MILIFGGSWAAIGVLQNEIWPLSNIKSHFPFHPIFFFLIYQYTYKIGNQGDHWTSTSRVLLPSEFNVSRRIKLHFF